MTNLLARILLSIMVIPLGAMACVVSFLALVEAVDEEAAISGSAFIAACLVAAYWLFLWRKSVRWTPQRAGRTVVASIGAIVAGLAVALLLNIISGIHELTFVLFFGTIFAVVAWLPLTVLLWRETAAERADRIRQSAGDVVFCPTCGYNMTGLYEPRCPECGGRFTLNQLYAAQQRQELADAATAEQQP